MSYQSEWNRILGEVGSAARTAGVFTKGSELVNKQQETVNEQRELRKDINTMFGPDYSEEEIEAAAKEYNINVDEFRNRRERLMKLNGGSSFVADPEYDIPGGIPRHEEVDGKLQINLPYEAGPKGKANFEYGYLPDDNTPAIRRALRVRAYNRYAEFVNDRMNQRNTLDERYEMLGGNA